jgi:hypothetical protein
VPGTLRWLGLPKPGLKELEIFNWQGKKLIDIEPGVVFKG